jgi:two-component system KDP operon response regulator KdpE
VSRSWILLVEDDEAIAAGLVRVLESQGYAVRHVARGQPALDGADADVGLVILDLGLPDMDGVTVATALRGWSTTPIVVLSARDAEPVKVAALDAGADDYVTKPFAMNEFLARLRAALRRAAPTEQERDIATDDFTIDLGAKQIRRNGDTLHLTPTEWQIVEVLARQRGKLVTQQQLLQQVWGPQYERETHYLRIYMSQIRRKLEPDPSRPRYFITEPGMGYRFVMEEP